MRITEIQLHPLTVPLKEPFVISFGPITHARNVVVRILTDTGLTGVGEASPFPTLVGETQETAMAMGSDLARLIVGEDALAIEDRLAQLDRAVPANSTIKSAFDMALYDLLGKSAGLPLYRVLGGAAPGPVFTDMTVSIAEPDVMARQARRFLDEGFPYLKVKLGGDPGEDIARMRAVRQAVGGEVPLRIDANQGWDALGAIRALKGLAEFGIDYCEEPVPRWDHEGLARVAAVSPIPIMADESVFDHRDLFRLARRGACHYVNIKLSKSGGIHNALKIVSVAEAAGMKCQVGCMIETRHALTALLHLIAARRAIVHFDVDSSLMHAEDPVVGGIEYRGRGEWHLPDAPGLGSEFAADVYALPGTVIVQEGASHG
jgi:L-alanine-DL-glutamate epimerase-like enolase superfamily enzyme